MLRPTALELAYGAMYGEYPEANRPRALDDRGRTPLAALENAILPALEHPPCLVSFSGGRDSSSVLGAASRAARREGLPLPVPVILRIPDAPATKESEWQERVLRHLQLRDWVVRELGDELDLLGPYATETLRRHGVLAPANCFFMRPALEEAEGGSLLTGWGGDQLFGSWRLRRQADVLARRRAPTLRDILRLGFAASPAAARRRVEARRFREWIPPWVSPDAARRLASELARSEMSTMPRSWRGWVAWCARQRHTCAAMWSVGLLASDAGVLVMHPLLDPAFLGALAAAGGRLGFGNRTAVMRAVFADALPEDVLSRRTQATFHGAFWRRHTREFAESWRGNGVDHKLIDATALRREWLSPSPAHGSAMLLQAAWLSEHS